MLNDKNLIEAVDIALLAGRMMLQYGAETDKVEQVIQNLGGSLGADKLISVITHNSIILTVLSGDEFRTKIVKVIRQGVNYDVISSVGRLGHVALNEGLSAKEVKKRLDEIEKKERNYSNWLTFATAALACSAFCMLFGGSLSMIVFVFVAAFAGMMVRHYLIKAQLNALLIPLISAFVATIVSSISVFFISDPKLVFASSILFLIPGVQLINSAEDILKGHLVVGATRGFMGILISLSIAFGITFGLIFVRSVL
ncbi:MAG: threonine/serine exporter ThrE family protein [Campylobacterales bacterium]